MSIHLFGYTEQDMQAQTLELNELGAFLCGSPGPCDEPFAQLIRQEFAAQEAYRQRITEALQKAVAAIRERAARKAPELSMPYGPHGQAPYSAGYLAGEYKARCEDAQLLQDVLNTVLAEAAG